MDATAAMYVVVLQLEPCFNRWSSSRAHQNQPLLVFQQKDHFQNDRRVILHKVLFVKSNKYFSVHEEGGSDSYIFFHPPCTVLVRIVFVSDGQEMWAFLGSVWLFLEEVEHCYDIFRNPLNPKNWETLCLNKCGWQRDGTAGMTKRHIHLSMFSSFSLLLCNPHKKI